MSFTYSVTDGYVCLVGSGVVSMLDRAECVKSMLADTSLPVPSNVLIDVTAVANSPDVGNVPMIQLMIGLLQEKFGGKVAILNTVVGHVFLSHVVAFSVAENCRAVHSLREATDWFAE